MLTIDTMKPTVEQLGALLATRRIERPEEGYWQDFLCEFHHRQREQAVPESGLVAMWRRLSGFAAELGSARWAYGAGVAYAAVTVAFLVMPSKVGVERPAPVPVNHQVVPATTPANGASALPPQGAKPAEQAPRAGDQVF